MRKLTKILKENWPVIPLVAAMSVVVYGVGDACHNAYELFKDPDANQALVNVVKDNLIVAGGCFGTAGFCKLNEYHKRKTYSVGRRGTGRGHAHIRSFGP